MTILVAVSRSPNRDDVLGTAIRLGRAFGEELYIVNLIENQSPTDDPWQIRRELRQRVLRENVVATIAVEPVDGSLLRAGPRLGRELLDFAAEDDVTHIVVGHSSKGVLGDITQGNTAFTVADTAPVPVTVVPEGASTPDDGYG